MDSFQTLILLIFAAAILVGIAQKIHISYPIALVIGGTALGFMPGLKPIYFDPNLILVVVLPPILYYASFSISFREFKRNWQTIFSLALGLVVVSTLVIGIIFKWIFPEFPWALAFAFGAIVSPPDSVATTTILKRFAIGPRLLAILEGESLINDASALILYKLAVIALLSGIFSFTEATLEFFKIVSGGVIVGFILGFLLQRFSRRYLDPVVGVLFSFTMPYITYISADYLGVSGVLAVVVNGLIGSRIVAMHHSSLRRILGWAVWDIFIILMNCFVFILIGLELRALTMVMQTKEMLLYTGYACLITFAMIVIRLLWVYARSGIGYIKALTNPKTVTLCPQILQDAAIIGWSGMRGIVSLAAALALPFTLPNGMPLAGRNEVIFITFVVILISLLLPAFTLSSLIRWLKLDHHVDHQIIHKARKQLAKVAEEKIHQLHSSHSVTDKEFDFLKVYFTLQRYVSEIASSTRKKMSDLESARLKVFEAQRNELLQLWERQEIDDKLLRQLEHELDMEETQIARAELN
jgi:monovalent cation/hydrogen antiporter